MSGDFNKYVNYHIVSWEEFHRDTRALAKRLLSKGKWNKIVSIARGGMVPATIISREMNIRHVDTICVASYNGERQGDIEIIKPLQDSSSDVLLIDDLVDTGITARVVREMLPHAHFATVYAKPAGIKMVDSYMSEVSQDTWIRLPWDMELAFSKPLAEHLCA